MSSKRKRKRVTDTLSESMGIEFKQSDYSNYLGKYGRRAKVWEHFLRRRDGLKAQCKLCTDLPVLIPTKDNNTSGLTRHIQTVHSILQSTSQPDSEVELTTEPEKAKTPKASIRNYFPPSKEETLESLISELAANDGLSFECIAKSRVIRRLFSTSPFGKLPLSHNTIRDIVMNFGKRIKAEKIDQLKKRKTEGEKFSLTLDEWTSKSNKRYLNINVHCYNSDHVNLGLARIESYFKSEDCLLLVKEKLSEFGLDDIVGCTNDGAIVMQKFGKISLIINQMCFAHAVQLAVVDVFYENKAPVEIPEQQPGTKELIQDEGTEDLEEAEDLEESNDQATAPELLPNSANIIFKNKKMREIIERIRICVRFFRKSPTKNAILQKQITSDKEEIEARRNVRLQGELQLILDNKTRWTSLYSMLKRYLDLQSSVEKTLISLKNEKNRDKSLAKIISFTDEENDLLQDLVATLGALKDAVDELQAEDINLLNVEEIFSVLLSQLRRLKTDFSKTIGAKLEYRISERRTMCSKVLYTLHHGINADIESDSSDEESTFKPNKNLMLDRKSMKEFLHSLLRRLLADKLDEYPNSDEDVSEPPRKRSTIVSFPAYDPNLSMREDKAEETTC